MLGKLFGRSSKEKIEDSKPEDSIENEASSLQSNNDEILIINEAFSEFSSEIFPHGLNAALLKTDIKSNKNSILVEMWMPFPCAGELQPLATSLSESLSKEVTIRVHISVKPVRQHQIPNVKNIIAIASGKGGVGKSTTSVNLAYALMAEGATVGILDADIYGPSIPKMLGVVDEKPSSVDRKLMQPISIDGLAAMSIGFLVSDEQATVWRGPMASSAFGQLLNETAWPDLDYLIIDMPPGTGDIQLTLAQKVPVAASVIVTTPQDIALIDAVKGIAMFDKVKVPVLGIVENMSYHTCENCGHESHIFGVDGGIEMAKKHNVSMLGQLPLNATIRLAADIGENTIQSNSTSEIAIQYRKIARNIAAQLFWQLDTRSPDTANIDIVKLDN